LSLQETSEVRVIEKPKSKTRTNKLVREKLDEEVFGRVAKNLKWLEVLHGVARRTLEHDLILPNDVSPHSDAHRREFSFLLERVRSAERCFSDVFTPILTGLYPHKFELTELYGKYIVASYDLAKLCGTSELVTEQLWEETLPEGTVQGDSVDSGKRVIESLSSENEENDQFLKSVRHLHLAVTNFCSNVEHLKNRFKEDQEIAQLMVILHPRIEQIEDASTILYAYAKEEIQKRDNHNGDTSSLGARYTRDRSAPKTDSPASTHLPGLPSKSKSAKTTQKWKWEGRVYLDSVAVKQVRDRKKVQDRSAQDKSAQDNESFKDA
jgi:hypothetical protein